MSSSTSSTSSIYSPSSNGGISGLASGLDTEALVEAMLASTQIKINTQNQKIQVLEWKQEQYRDITSQLLNLQNSFFSYSNNATNIRSEAFFNQVSLDGASTAVKFTNTNAASGANFTIDSVSQLASASKLTGKDGIKGNISLDNINLDDLKASADEKGNVSFNMALDGVSKTITVNVNDIDSVDKLSTRINEQLNMKFGSGITTAVADGKLIIGAPTTDVTDIDGIANKTDRKFELTVDNEAARKALGMEEVSVSNKIQVGLSLSSQGLKANKSTWDETEVDSSGNIVYEKEEDGTYKVDENGNKIPKKKTITGYQFKINGEEFKIAEDTSITNMMKKINSSNADVTMAYDSLNDRFTLTSKTTGQGVDINIEDTDGLMASLFGTKDDGSFAVVDGENAILEVNGQTIERNTNSFDIQGVMVTITAETNEATTVNASSNNDSIVKGIKDFVEAYNTMVKAITAKTTEAADYKDYPALTEAQKKEMSEDEIKTWEKKAQTGLLRGDSTLRSLLTELRSNLYKKAEENGIALYDLGIVTNTDGTLKIDSEAKLTTAIETRLEDVKTLFTDSNNGLATNINKTIDKYAKTSSASPGILVTKAGYKDTASATENNINKQIKSLKEYLERLQDTYDKQKNRYWKKFTTLEKLISNGNSTASYFASLSGGGY